MSPQQTEECPNTCSARFFPLLYFTSIHPVFALLKSYLYMADEKLSLVVRPVKEVERNHKSFFEILQVELIQMVSKQMSSQKLHLSGPTPIRPVLLTGHINWLHVDQSMDNFLDQTCSGSFVQVILLISVIQLVMSGHWSAIIYILPQVISKCNPTTPFSIPLIFLGLLVLKRNISHLHRCITCHQPGLLCVE